MDDYCNVCGDEGSELTLTESGKTICDKCSMDVLAEEYESYRKNAETLRIVTEARERIRNRKE